MKNHVRELAKNDPDYHDIRSKILLDAAQHLTKYADSEDAVGENVMGLNEAAAELRRMASNARRTHKKLQDARRQAARASEAKWKAFTGS